MKTCGTCFHAAQHLDPQDPASICNTCTKNDKWVARDVFKDIDDTMTDLDIPVGVKYDQDKPEWTLVPFKAFDEVVKVLTIGARKYSPDNWKKVPDARRRYINAAFRHMSAYVSGEKLDAETGKSHLAHAICCMLFLLAFDIEGKQ
jgi:hypothetical protein